MKIRLKLERLYSSVINSEDGNFFLELKKYLDYIKSNRKLKKGVKKLENNFKKDSKEYRSFSRKTTKRFIEIKSIFEKKNVGNKQLKKLFHEFEGHISGKITSSATLTESFFYILQGIISIFKENKKRFPKELEEEILKLFNEYNKIKKSFDYKKRVAEWNSFYELEHVDFLEEDLSNSEMNISLLGKALVKGNMEKIIDGFESLSQAKRKEYLNHLKKVQEYFLEELEERKGLKNPAIWISFLIVLPLFLSILIYNPFIKYDVEDNLIKKVNFDEGSNTYIFQIDNLNESRINDELIVNFIESFTRTSISFKQYNLYFEDDSYLETPKKALLEYDLSIEGRDLNIKHKESKIVKEDIDFNKAYEITLSPKLIFIGDDTKNVESFEFQPFFGFFIKKSFSEFIFKFIFFYVVWVTLIIIPINFVLNKLFKRKS